MKNKNTLLIMLGAALTLPVATMFVAAQTGAARKGRPQGPCDVYAAGGSPCVAAHSSTRALYAAYNGPLYQVLRQSDGKKMDIGVVQPSATDGGGYADAAAQDNFCANTYCWITTLYDQSGHHNDITQAPRGPAGVPMVMGGFNNLPVADWAPVTVMGHKVYGVFIAPGMGLRNDNPHHTAVDDQAEGQYWVVNGQHYNGGCCFDYGNGEIDSRDDGDGTMETAYFGNGTGWYHGPAPGPWIMTDQENNLVGCVTDSPNNKNCDIPIITWRFVTATADGEPHHWRSMGGDAQTGTMKIIYDGQRVQNPRNSYDPMRKQGAIILGNGGDNSNGSQGTFYEGAMTEGGTFPSQETNQKLQANIVAAKYDVAALSVTTAGTSASANATSLGLLTFSPGESKTVSVTFKNTTTTPIAKQVLSIAVPKGWTADRVGGAASGEIAPGAGESVAFKITSGKASFNGDLIAKASWTVDGMPQSETSLVKVRNVSPVKINEFADGATQSFIELYNAGDSAVDLSNWVLTEHPIAQPVFSTVKIPSGTKLAAKGFYLFGLANSGLAVPAQKGDATLHVRSVTGMNVGDTVQIGSGSAMETRKIAAVGTSAGTSTTLWQPLPEGPIITVAPGATNVPYTPGGGFAVEVGQKLALGYGAIHPSVAGEVEKYEVVTVTAVGKPGAQTYLAANAKAGDTTLRVRSAASISAGDKINLDIDSIDHGNETITIKSVGETGGGGRGGVELDLAAPLKFNHASNLPLSVWGSGITFQPATKFPHTSNEPLLPLGTGITLDKPLSSDHAINSVVQDASVTTAGYQGTPAPNQWFGGPAIANEGNIVLRDAAGLVVDSLNYGHVVDPWAAEGYQGASPGSGCYVPALGGGRGGFGGRGPGGASNRSAGRFPDGADTDSNCDDFHLQNSSAMAADAAAGANNIKASSVAGLANGQTIFIDSGANRETATVATVGTPGGTTVRTATEAGATSVPVALAFGFSPGQTITIDDGDNRETAVVASIAGGGRGRNGPGGGAVTISGPLTKAHAEGVQVSGSGITLTAALTKSHSAGAAISGNVPTPGAPNKYAKRSE